MAAFPTPLRQPPINRIGPGYSGCRGQLLCQVLSLGTDSRALQFSLPEQHGTPAAFNKPLISIRRCRSFRTWLG
jgi:hypothetical protein